MQQVTIVFIYQRDLYYFPENQRFKNKMIDYAHHCHHCNCVQEFSLCRLLANGYWLDGVSLVGRINWDGGGGFGYLNHPRLIELNIETECDQLGSCHFFLRKFLHVIHLKKINNNIDIFKETLLNCENTVHLQESHSPLLF